MEKDGFKLVVNRKNKRRRRLKYTIETPSFMKRDLESVEKSLTGCKHTLEVEGVFKDFLFDVQSHLPASNIDKIVCYGLGSPCCSNASVWQLAFLLILTESIQSSVEIFDPDFSSDDILLFNKLKFKVVNNNENCMRSVCKPTVFFMPHCTFELTNNLLYANWSSDLLPNCFLFGNTLASVGDLPNGNHFEYINKSMHLQSELLWDGDEYDYNNSFSSLAFTKFNKNLIDVSPKELWLDPKEPLVLPEKH